MSALLGDLSSTPGSLDPAVWQRADAALPPPLTEDERRSAIHADAQAAVQGEFATYQFEHVEGEHGYVGDDWHDWDDADEVITLLVAPDADAPGDVAGVDDLPDDVVRQMLKDMLRHQAGHDSWVTGEVGVEPEDDHERSRDRLELVERELRRHDAMLLALAHPVDVLTTVAAAASVMHAVDALRSTFQLDHDQAHAVLGLRFQRATRDDVDRLRRRRSELVDLLEDLRRPPQG